MIFPLRQLWLSERCFVKRAKIVLILKQIINIYVCETVIKNCSFGYQFSNMAGLSISRKRESGILYYVNGNQLFISRKNAFPVYI